MNNYFVVITGAASGIGRALCENYNRKGVAVYAIDKNILELESLATSLQNNFNTDFFTYITDLSIKEEIEKLSFDILSKINNRKLILINNAGANLISGFMKDTPLEGFEWLMKTNLWSIVYLSQNLLPYMHAKNEGHIVNVSSVFGLFGVKTCVPYCTSKFAVRGYTEALRMELARTNIYTTCVHPGGIRTNINVNSKLMGSKINEDTKERVNKLFLKQARTSPDIAAQNIVDAIENKKLRLLIGADAKVFDIIVRLFPARYQQVFDLITKIFYPKSLNNIDKVYS
jgi:short-subunit dehydrogenase